MSELAAVVLAAGVSSNKGNFKPLLPVDGQSLIQRVVVSMKNAGAETVIVVTGYKREELETHLADAGVTFVYNAAYYETQMLDSLLLGLAALSAETKRVLICPADLPLIKPETIQALLETEGDFVRPSYQGTTGRPIVMSPHLMKTLREYQGDGGIRAAIASCGIVPVDVPVDDPGVLLDDHDIRDEYAALLKYHRQMTDAPQPLQLDLQICLRAETLFWGTDCAQFLEMIQTTGSMLNACQCMRMSYSRGWRMVNEIERQLGYPILVRSQGGNSGGGSELTPMGARFLSAYQNMREEINRESQAIFARYFPGGALADE